MADKSLREINKTTTELKELQYEYKSAKGDMLNRSKQSELMHAVEPLGLKELTTSPVVLIDSSEQWAGSSRSEAMSNEQKAIGENLENKIQFCFVEKNE